MQDKGKGLQFTASRVGDMLHKHRSAVMDIHTWTLQQPALARYGRRNEVVIYARTDSRTPAENIVLNLLNASTRFKTGITMVW